MDWSIAQQKYMLWLAVPSKDRSKSLKTREDVAIVLGVSLEDMQLWEASAGWWDDTFAISRAIIGHKLSDILEATAREAIRGSVAAQKLAYTLLGVTAERVEHKIALDDDRLVIVMQRAPEGAPVQPVQGLPSPVSSEVNHASSS